jgi:hypothetical protein
LSVNNILPLGQITHPLLIFDISFGILIFEYKDSLISLIACTDGGSTTEIICACLLFSVLSTALCEPVSMATDPNVVIADTKSKILLSMLLDLMAMAELIKTAKTSSIIATIEQSPRDMKHNIDIIVKDIEENLSSIRKQRQHYSDEIKQIRVKINSHLDTIEQRIMGDLIDVEGNVKLQIENLLTELSKRSDTINVFV